MIVTHCNVVATGCLSQSCACACTRCYSLTSLEAVRAAETGKPVTATGMLARILDLSKPHGGTYASTQMAEIHRNARALAELAGDIAPRALEPEEEDR